MPVQISELNGQNESINKLFSQAKEEMAVIFDLSELYL